jgi:hypothetical protein
VQCSCTRASCQFKQAALYVRPLTEDFLLTSCTSLVCPVIVGRTHGLGTMDLPETRLRALAAEAGFSSVRQLPLENPFHTLYQLKP